MTSHTPPPHSSKLPSTVFSADCQCLGGRIGVRGMGYHAPTPQAGRVTDCHGERGEGGGGGGDEGWGLGEGGTMPPCYMDLERITFYIDYEAFKQWH